MNLPHSFKNDFQIKNINLDTFIYKHEI